MIYLIYGITDCPSCLRAEADLMEADKEYVVISADFSKSYRKLIREQLKWPTFPIVVLQEDNNNTIIGGLEQLRDHLDRI
mgnify:FL=1